MALHCALLIVAGSDLSLKLRFFDFFFIKKNSLLDNDVYKYAKHF